MSAPFYCKKVIMMTSKRKKTLLYGTFAAAVVFAFIQVTYFNEAYSPLQVLSDARSEAKRLLKFITLYHYQCNATIQGLNLSQWPVCVEKAGGLNLVLGGPRIMYSVGPTPDYPLERTLALNFSYQVHVFHHEQLTTDFLQATRNKTHIFKTTIVPNDPSDYGRNSFDTKTLNNVFETLKHQVVDILKIETLVDRVHSHELVHYLVKDRLLSKVRQLHLTLYIDKVDDDYLYSWYKALYMLFQNAGFRLYHSGASDPLCLQVTLMESCVYYMSWIRDPGPEIFVLHPPAIDGSIGFENDRLEDYLEDTETTCSRELEVKVHRSTMTLCLDMTIINPKGPCQLVIISHTSEAGSLSEVPQTKCSVIILQIVSHNTDEHRFYVTQHSSGSSSSEQTSLVKALQNVFQFSSENILYVDQSQSFWSILHEVLNSGALFNVNQLILKIQNMFDGTQATHFRMRYSKLKRVEAYGFRKYQIVDGNADKTLRFHSRKMPESTTSHTLNYLKSASSWTG